MKKMLGATVAAIVSLFLLVGGAHAWQGRMAGMGDPYGLVEDESDFLINPAKMADGQGVRYYGNYRFTYTDVSRWSWNSVLEVNGLNTNIGGLRNATGSETDHDAQVGTAFPLGRGRMGFFFDYSGKRGDFDNGKTMYPGSAFSSTFNMNSDFDNFAFKLLYAQPISSDIKFGAELQFARRSEENRFSETTILTAGPIVLPIFSMTNGFNGNLFPFMTPYDSTYWEALFKTGLEGNFGPTKVGMTLRGGTIFSGDNSLTRTDTILIPVVAQTSRVGMNGDVDGWKIGGDFMARYAYSASLSFPFSVTVDYSEKTRDAAGSGSLLATTLDRPFFPFVLSLPIPEGTDILNFSFENKEKSLQLEVGGGVDWAVTKTSRFAVGLYYDYINTKSEWTGTDTLTGLPGSLGVSSRPRMPEDTEHLARFKIAGEGQLSPAWTLRGGLNFFAGLVHEDLSSSFVLLGSVPFNSLNASMDGRRWGISAYLGATTMYKGITIEPFISGGYQETTLEDTNATSTLGTTTAFQWDMTKDNRQAVLGTGLSILF